MCLCVRACFSEAAGEEKGEKLARENKVNEA